LKELNAEKPVLEFCLFQTGIFMNYIVYPHVTAKHLFISPVGFDVEEGHAIMVEDGEEFRAYITIQDVAKVVAAAIGYEGKWPETGGMVGAKMQSKELIKLVEKHAGTSPFLSTNIIHLLMVKLTIFDT
jgi:nucleoside-diphosphate-sugar epimerase